MKRTCILGLTMWWKLGALAAVTAAILFFLLAPTATMTVKVDLPPEAHRVSVTQVQSVVEGTIWITEAVMVVAVLGIAGWIAWRIVRHHRIST